MAIEKPAGLAAKPAIYTRFAAELAAGRDPESAAVEALLARLRAHLVREIRRRSLWHLSPSYLGIHGYRAWTDAGASRGAGPLDELLLDAFTALFIERLPTLAGYLREGNTLEALIPQLLRHFVHDAQARNDRLGFRLFRLLRSAVRQEEAAGRIELVGGDRRVTGGTVVRLTASSTATSEEERRELLLAQVARWNDELLADLVAAPNRRVPAVVARLGQLLVELGETGLGSFRFGELVGAVRLDTRRRWTALFESELGERAWEDDDEPEAWQALCRAVEPEVEARLVAEDGFRHLIDCVARHIETMDAPERTRDHLFKLWGFLRAFATEEAPALGSRPSERLPAKKGLARWLGLPRDRCAEMLRTLGGFLTHCRGTDAFARGAT